MPGRMTDAYKGEVEYHLRGRAENLEDDAAKILALLADGHWSEAQRELMAVQRNVVNMHTMCVNLENEEKWRSEP